ncbi:hypothetical protein C0J52_26812 [Blattella germanica]|nr:hypothetical protein C0J52_26812 [Blattella germanica]
MGNSHNHRYKEENSFKATRGEFTLPDPAYTGILPISLLKWKDLKELSKLLTKKE